MKISFQRKKTMSKLSRRHKKNIEKTDKVVFSSLEEELKH